MRTLALVFAFSLPVLASDTRDNCTTVENARGELEIKCGPIQPVEIIIPRSPEAKRAVETAGDEALERAAERR